MKRSDKKGLFWFLVLTFLSTYLVEFILMANGVSFDKVPPVYAEFIVAGVMFCPGISAFIVRKYITKEGFKDSGLKFGKLKSYLNVYLTVPLLFAVIYGLTWFFVSRPDFTLKSFVLQYGLPALPAPPAAIIAAIIVSSLTFAPFINSVPAFGEEFGWRGYLLPKLMFMGKAKALVITGIIWGLWHVPLILMGYKYGNYTLPGIIFFTLLLMFVGIYVGYLRIRSGSVYLAAFVHGVLNAQAYGIWTVIFPDINPLIGGWTGIAGIVVFGLLGIKIMSMLKNS